MERSGLAEGGGRWPDHQAHGTAWAGGSVPTLPSWEPRMVSAVTQDLQAMSLGTQPEWGGPDPCVS